MLRPCSRPALARSTRDRRPPVQPLRGPQASQLHQEPPSPPPAPRRLLLLRRAGLGALAALLGVAIPPAALLSSVALGLCGSAALYLGAVLQQARRVGGGSGFAMASESPLLRLGHLSAPNAAAVGVAVYLLAGLCEIGGGWLVWQAVRCGKPRWWAALGALILVAYGFVATLQPVAQFGRAFALYGGYFVVLSVAWGAALDGFKPDAGDYVGCALVLAGVAVMTAWPRA